MKIGKTKFTFSVNIGNSIGLEIKTNDKFGTVFYTAQHPKYSKSQAEFICKAVNNHDKLVNALDAIVNRFGSLKEVQALGIEKELLEAVTVLKTAK